ncbi:phospholipase [Modestobacter lapidis]|nr:phospholipase [Modestobacter lapidis]
MTARPTATPGASLPVPGTRPLGLVAEGDPLLHVPPALPAGRPAPLVITLHGAGGDAVAGLALLRALADERGLLLLAPSSRGPTWDAIRNGYGPDLELLDRALDRVFSTVRVDAEQVAVAGFSDGASYALGVGLANGALLRRVVAFSPGFVPRGPRAGRPAVFVSHGVADEVLPVARTSGRIVPALRDDGYDVTYREFAGPHTVPPEVAREAVDWLDPDGPR